MFEKLKRKLAGDSPGVVEVPDPAMFEQTPHVRPQRIRRQRHGNAIVMQEVLDYLRMYEGEYIETEDISIELGISEGYANRVVRMLIEAGAIVRKGKRGTYTYTVKRKRALKAAPRGRSVAKQEKAARRVAEIRKSANDHEMSLVGTEKETRVLNVIRQHQHEFISQAEIAQMAGVSPAQVSVVARKFETEGRISRSAPVHRHGTKYAVNESVTGTGPNRKALNLPSAPVPLRTESYEGSLIREFLSWRKSKEG